MRAGILPLAALLVLVVAPAQAEESAGPLSLNTAIELALKNDIRLLPGKTALQIAQLRQDAAPVWRDPEARLETGLGTEQNSLDSALRVYLPHPWMVKAAALENASLTASAAAEHQMAGLATATEAFRLYREFQCLEREASLATRLVEIKKELAGLSEQHLAAAMETSSRALLLCWELRAAEQEERALRRELHVLKNRLAARTGLAPEKLRLPALDFAAPFNPVNPEQAVHSALERRPDLHLLQAQLQEADSQMRLVRAERIPWLNYVQPSYSDRSAEWAVQVAVNIPVFSLSGSKKGQALAERSLRQTALAVSKEAVSIQVREALEALASATEEWTVHQAEQLELADATRTEIKKLQELAPSVPGEWLALDEQMVQAERRLLQTLRAVYSAQADLFFATGQPLLIPE